QHKGSVHSDPVIAASLVTRESPDQHKGSVHSDPVIAASLITRESPDQHKGSVHAEAIKAPRVETIGQKLYEDYKSRTELTVAQSQQVAVYEQQNHIAPNAVPAPAAAPAPVISGSVPTHTAADYTPDYTQTNDNPTVVDTIQDATMQKTVGDLNQNIEGAYNLGSQAKTAADTAQAAATNAQTTADSKVAQTDFDASQARQDSWIGAVQKKADDNKLLINANTQGVADNKDAVSKLDTRVTGHDRGIQTNTADIATNKAAISTETTRATSAEQQNASGISTNKTDIQTNKGEIAANKTAIAAKVDTTTYDAGQKAQNDQITANTNGVANNGKEIRTIQNLQNTQGAYVQQMDNQVKSNTKTLAKHDARISKNSADIAQNKRDIQDTRKELKRGLNNAAAMTGLHYKSDNSWALSTGTANGDGAAIAGGIQKGITSHLNANVQASTSMDGGWMASVGLSGDF
ncbi:hypothetical protein ACVOZ6_003427, partial [Escherichia coli]